MVQSLTVLLELAAQRKATLTKGATVVAVTTINDPFTVIPKGTKGIVKKVDDIGTVHTEWENSKTLGATLEDEIKLV